MARPGCPGNLLSFRAGEEGVLYSKEDSLVPAKWTSTFSSRPKPQETRRSIPSLPLWGRGVVLHLQALCFPVLACVLLCPGLCEAPPSLWVIVLRVFPGTHRDRAATSPVLPGSLAPFPPYLPSPLSNSPHFLASGLFPCIPFTLFFLSARATSLPPRSLQPTQPDWTEFRTSEKKLDLLS